MVATDNLFQLIKSLNKAEKRNFKLFASRYSGSKVYLKLFDAIDKQKEYDEEEILTIFSKEKFSKHLHRIKNYLSDLILSSIETLNANHDIDVQLKHLSLKSDILFNKGLFRQCSKINQKAKKIAAENYRFLHLLDILIRQKSLMNFNNSPLSEFKQVHDELNRVLEDIKNTERYRFLQSLILNFSEGKKEKSLLKEIKMHMRQDFFKSEKNAINIKSKLSFNNLQQLYYGSIGKDLKKSNEFAKKYVEIIESNPVLLKTSYRDYQTGLNNLIITYIQIGKYDKAQERIVAMRTFYEKYGIKLQPAFIAKIFVQSYSLELGLIIFSKNYEKLHSIVPAIEAGLQRYKLLITKSWRITLLFNIAFIYFLLHQHKKSLKWINKLLIHPFIESKHRTLNAARFINLILHYELGNFELIPNIVKLNREFLLKYIRYNKGGKIILDFFSNEALSDITLGERRVLFGKLRTELIEICEDPGEKAILDEIHFIEWLESKIENKGWRGGNEAVLSNDTQSVI